MNEDPRLLEMAMQIALLKEQIRVADVAYQYLHGEHKKLIKALEDIKDNDGPGLDGSPGGTCYEIAKAALI